MHRRRRARPITDNGTERTSAPRYTGTERTSALPLKRNQQIHKDDDDRAITETAPARPPSSSSSDHWTVTGLLHRAARDEARRRNKGPGYAAGIRNRWDTETDPEGHTRRSKLEVWHAAGLTRADATVALLADAPLEAPPRSAAVQRHPEDCSACGGTCEIETAEIRNGAIVRTFAPCKAVAL